MSSVIRISLNVASAHFYKSETSICVTGFVNSALGTPGVVCNLAVLGVTRTVGLCGLLRPGASRRCCRPRPLLDLCQLAGVRIEPKMTGIVSTVLCGIAYVRLMDTATLNDTVQKQVM